MRLWIHCSAMLSRSGWRLSHCKRSVATHARHRSKALIAIDDGTFYKSYPSETIASSNPPIFPRLSFSLPSNVGTTSNQEHWSVLSNSSLARTTLLRVLAGSYIATPPTCRTYPLFTEQGIHRSNAIAYIGFDAERTGHSAVRGAYLSARYESRKEETDFTLLDYLTGNTELNPLEGARAYDKALLDSCVKDLRLGSLLSMPVGNLSNGQTRRARIAKALMTGPELLLLDGPFMGLDPPSVRLLSSVLQRLARASRPHLVLSLRQGDLIPDWTTHLIAVEDTSCIRAKGPKAHVLSTLGSAGLQPDFSQERLSTDGFPATFPPRKLGEAVVEIRGARVKYGDSPRPVLGGWEGGLNFNLRRGQRMALLGPNGSGKTTLLSLITSDHPQAYSQPVRIFGRSRLPEPGEKGISVFELQRRIGHSSPEVHAFFPRQLSVRRSLESAWADAPLAKPAPLSVGDSKRVDRVLAWFETELRGSSGSSSTATAATTRRSTRNLAPSEELHRREADLTWALDVRFGELPFSSQRLLLFLRAVVARQELIVLDEAFSGMDRAVRDKAFLFLAHGDQDPKRAAAAAVLSSSDVNDDDDDDDEATADVQRSVAPSGVVGGLTDQQVLLVIAHDRGDVPGCVREWMCLSEPAGEGEQQAPPRWGELAGPLELNPGAWSEIWGEPSRSQSSGRGH